VIAIGLLLAACKGGSGAGAGAKQKDAGLVATDAPAVAVDLSFVRGSVYVAEAEDHGHVRMRVLENGGWRDLGSNLFPSGSMWQGGLLAISAEGESESEHVEQLVIVRDGKVEPFGGKHQLVRNPVVVGDVLVVETNEHGFRDLYRLDAAGTARRLTSNKEGNFEPALSPDGTTLAFTSSRDGDSEIYRMPSAGGAATRLTAFHRDDWSPLWSPDGRTLLFLSDREGMPRLFMMNPDGTAQRRVTAETDPELIEDLPRFSPDGRHLAFIRGRGAVQTLRVLDLSSGKSTDITPADHSDRDFTWSPDGSYLAVVRHIVTSGKLGPSALTFVRISDNVATADPRANPVLIRWL
jgi:TolB protein